MGRLHFSSAPKYQKVEAVCEAQTFPTWADQAFDPEAEVLSGHMMVYEAFLDKDARPPLTDDADAISELISESSSSAATEDEEFTSVSVRGPARERLQSPSSPTLSPQTAEPGSNDFDDFVRVEVPPAEPDGRPLTMPRPSSPLRQSIMNPNLDESPEHPSSDTPEVAIQHGDEEHLFHYYRHYAGEGERWQHAPRVIPGFDSRTGSPARRIPGHPRFISRAEGQRAPLANLPVADHPHARPRPRSASVSDALASGARAPERWFSAIDGTVISSRVLAQR